MTVLTLRGKCSWFGGPDDTGVSPDEGLAFIYDVSDAPYLFLPEQPSGTTGLARRLDPDKYYIACRWDYDQFPKESLLHHTAHVMAVKTGKAIECLPADWGPHESTDRVADLSPAALDVLGLNTDDEVQVIYPYRTLEKPIMPYKRIVISSGHGLHVRGASGILDEVDEARRVVETLATELRKRKVEVVTFHDDTSKDQSANLETIVDFHNDQDRDLDISIHFNAFEQTSDPRGTETLYISQSALASQVSAAIASCGFINRGGKKRTDLYFLNNTDAPAILIETCFVDSEADAEIYEDNYSDICDAIADVLGGIEGGAPVPEPIPPTPIPPLTPTPRIDIEVSGDVIIYINGERISTSPDS
jgi:N-acetylmuramoyl-L-alanine amidase